ncbi:unnamed protein product [Ranitomeya imitator]|uniref:Saposin B-type domain-containing protein n=1 Tax=Ranitomeya imitator TaxID=111125 RepID=A0ABN9MQ47_9NEOB|nr:unnamed protein product [Ranitomeya imitator]
MQEQTARIMASYRDETLPNCAKQCGELCDLVLVFFDPMGQALCKRTLDIVEKINESHGDNYCTST